MLPIERQKQIKRLIQTKKILRINELSVQFNVSEMTIYRDIKPLVEEGFVTKTAGGISLKEKNQSLLKADNCVYCQRQNHSKLVYRLILSDDKLETACCAHCGLLRHRQLGDKVTHAICHDFFMDTTISASLAWFVMDTTLHVTCCQPQVLTFANKEHAEKFIKGFDGKIFGFQNAMDVVYEKMEDHVGE